MERSLTGVAAVALSLLAATYLGTPGPGPGVPTPTPNHTPPAPPPYSHSYYIDNYSNNPDPNTIAWMGVADGAFDSSRCTPHSLVVLDFGEPWKSQSDQPYGGYGTNYWLNYSPFYQFISDGDILSLVEKYVDGWYAAASSSCGYLSVVVGTNNTAAFASSNGGDPSVAGFYWAAVGYYLNQYLINNGYSSRVSALTGGDMETDWECVDRTEQFVNGYHYNSSAGEMFDFGTAWVPATCSGTGSTWTTYDVYYVAYGSRLDYPVPEIYSGPAADSWVSVRQSYYMYFEGLMTECQQGDPLPSDYCTNDPYVPAECRRDVAGQYAPDTAWHDFWVKLDNVGAQQSSLLSTTNIRWCH